MRSALFPVYATFHTFLVDISSGRQYMQAKMADCLQIKLELIPFDR